MYIAGRTRHRVRPCFLFQIPERAFPVDAPTHLNHTGVAYWHFVSNLTPIPSPAFLLAANSSMKAVKRKGDKPYSFPLYQALYLHVDASAPSIPHLHFEMDNAREREASTWIMLRKQHGSSPWPEARIAHHHPCGSRPRTPPVFPIRIDSPGRVRKAPRVGQRHTEQPPFRSACEPGIVRQNGLFDMLF